MMSLTCHHCGSKLDSNFKFCPSCGNAVLPADSLTETVPEEKPVTNESFVRCNNCGDENAFSASICSGCGMKLSGDIVSPVESKSSAAQANTAQKAPVKKSTALGKSGNKKPEQIAQQNEPAKFSQKNLLIIFAVLLVLAAIILYTGGVFDSPKIPASTMHISEAPGNTQQPQVDLGAQQHIDELEKQIAENPKDQDKILALAHVLNDAGFLDKAIVRYNEYLKFNPKNADAIIDLGVCYFNLKQFDAADSVMKKAIKVNPKHAIGLYNLGIVNLSKGDMEASKKWFQRVIDAAPESDQAKQAKQLLESHSTNK